MKRILGLVLLVTVILSMGSVATAGPINISYSVNGWGPVTLANEGQPGDTIELLAYSQLVLNLTEGIPTTAKINTLVFDINYTNPQGQFPVNFARPMSINVVTGSLSQTGLFDSWFTYNPNDALWLYAGSPSVFSVDGGTVTVTPLAVSILNAGNSHYEADVNATFEYAAVPDGGATLTLLGGALMAIGALRRKFRA